MSTTITCNENASTSISNKDQETLTEDIASLSIENKLESKLLNEKNLQDNEEKEDENDSDYEINEDEEEEQNLQEEEDDKLLDEICVNDNENEIEPKQELNEENENKDVNSEEIDVSKELNEALDIVRNVALKQKEIIVNKIYDEYQQTDGKEINPQDINDAFRLLKLQMNKNEEEINLEEQDDVDAKKEQEDNNDEDEEEEEEVIEMSSEEDDVDQNEENELEEEQELQEEDDEDDDIDIDEEDGDTSCPKTTEAIRQEIEEAMEIASELGKQARGELSQKYYETIIEATGEEPTQEQINNIFQRIQEQLSEEAQEELFDDCDEEDANDSINATSKILLEIQNMNEDEKKQEFEKAKELISEENQLQAKQQFINLSGREPNEQEYQDIIITFAQTKFTDDYFGNDNQDNKNADSDYDPEKDSEWNEKDQEIDQEEEETLDEKCERLENLKQQFEDKTLLKSFNAFANKTGKSPNIDEQIFHIKFLLGSKKINVSFNNDDDDNKDNKENQDNNNKQDDYVAPVDQLL